VSDHGVEEVSSNIGFALPALFGNGPAHPAKHANHAGIRAGRSLA
jgi:hypothetical protein